MTISAAALVQICIGMKLPAPVSVTVHEKKLNAVTGCSIRPELGCAVCSQKMEKYGADFIGGICYYKFRCTNPDCDVPIWTKEDEDSLPILTKEDELYYQRQEEQYQKDEAVAMAVLRSRYPNCHDRRFHHAEELLVYMIERAEKMRAAKLH